MRKLKACFYMILCKIVFHVALFIFNIEMNTKGKISEMCKNLNDTILHEWHAKAAKGYFRNIA